MGNANIDWIALSDADIVKQIGNFVRKNRLKQNITQAKLAKNAGLNRWTISKLENGDSVSLTVLIQILRALDVLYVLNQFEVIDEISPLEYARIKRKEKERARSRNSIEKDQEDTGW